MRAKGRVLEAGQLRAFRAYFRPLASVFLPSSIALISCVFAPLFPLKAQELSPQAVVQPTPEMQKRVIEHDPLKWLSSSLSCEELTDQIKARYKPLGKMADWPEEKKSELKQVLEVSCSERFRHCQFKNCPGGLQVPLTNTSAPDFRAYAVQELSRLVDEQRKRQAGAIERAVQNEQKRGAEWMRQSNPLEVGDDSDNEDRKEESRAPRGAPESRTPANSGSKSTTDDPYPERPSSGGSRSLSAPKSF